MPFACGRATWKGKPLALDKRINVLVVCKEMKTYSTRQVAELLGIHWVTLHQWIKRGKVIPPKITHVGRVKVRLWTQREVDRLRKERPRLYYQGKNGRRKSKR